MKGGRMKQECNGSNTVDIKLKICCDTRQEGCQYVRVIQSENINVSLCTRKSDKVKEQ